MGKTTPLEEKHLIELKLRSYELGYYQLTDAITINVENEIHIDIDETSGQFWFGTVQTLEELRVLIEIINR